MRTFLLSALLVLAGSDQAPAQPAPSTSEQQRPQTARPATNRSPHDKTTAVKATPAKAEPVKSLDAPMRVTIVRSAEPGCEPNCAEWIAAQGRVDATTPRQFKKVLAQLDKRRLPILIDSAGGAVDESIAIGRMIRAKGLDVAVTKTESAPCAPSDSACRKLTANGVVLGRPKAHLSKCASSCAFILAAGRHRFVGPTTFVGVHQITSYETRVKVLRTYRLETRREWGVPVETTKTLVSEKRIAEKTTLTPTKGSDYARIGKYFAEMGVGEGVMRALLATPSSSIHWFSRAELRETLMATEPTDGEQLITGVAARDAVAPSHSSASLVPPGIGKTESPGSKGLCGQAGGAPPSCPGTPEVPAVGTPAAIVAAPGAAVQMSPSVTVQPEAGAASIPAPSTRR